MKLNKLLILATSALLVVPAVSNAQLVFQRAFNLSGIINPGDENIENQIGASLLIEFWDTNAVAGVDQLKVTITNTGPAQSTISDFFLLRPADNMPITNPYSLDNTTSTPNNWGLATTMDNDLKGFAGVDTADYFGATASTNPDTRLEFPDITPQPSVGIFYFNFLDFTFDSNAWLNSFGAGDPLVAVRWQEVYYGDLQGASGKGISTGRGFDPQIPEPSEVASLAILGLGGILFARRRFAKKK